MHTIYKVSALSFNNTKHKYAIAFKETCRPVIGIDEATDYSMIDYYAISSMRHFKISSFTLTGDIMQCLHPKGVSDWNDLRHPLIFPSLEIKKLLVSYRQSPKLMKLAESLYEDTMKTKYPYRCYLSTEENTPAPLWFDSNDEEEKASWIINRVLEVRDAYNMVPSIAIFVNSESEARNLKELLEEDEDERFSDAGITVKDCSNGEALSDKNTVRIFTLDKVKGLEFEVVFFHNIHKIQDQHLLDKYLYVGLSRATFFMGVTADCVENNLISSVKDLFDVKGNWMDISSR